VLTEDGMDSGLIILALVFFASLLSLVGLIVYLVRRRSPRVQRKKQDARSDRALRREAQATGGRRRAIAAADYQEPSPAPEAEEAPQPDLPPSPATVVPADAATIVFRRHFPPLAGAASLSFYGGMPRTRTISEWPRAEHGRPLHFILQTDLTQIASDSVPPGLPREGRLLVFLGLEPEGAFAFRLMYDADSAAPIQELSPPEDIAPAYGAAGARVWPWALAAGHGTPILPQWPFDPLAVPLDGYGSPLADGLYAAQGEDIAADPFGPQDFQGSQNPWPGFPNDWLSIQITAAMLVRAVDDLSPQQAEGLWPELDEAERASEIAAIRQEAQAWFDHALNNPAFGSIGREVRGVFLDWFKAQGPIANRVAPAAFEAAVETSLHAHPEGATRVPVEVLLRLMHRHALIVRTGDSVQPQVYARMLGRPASAQGDDLARHVLLLELRSDPAIGHYFGDEILRFWILPEHLANQRFQEVVLTTSFV